MKAKKIVLLIALGVLLAGFLLWAVGAALGAKTLYLQNGELTVGDQPMGGFSIGSDVSVAASSKEGVAGLPQQMQVSRLKLLPDVGDLTVQPGDGWDLSYDLRYPERLHWSVEDGTLTVEYDYPEFHLSMDCFFCVIRSGELVLKEHEAAKWLTAETLDSVDWLPADQGLVEGIREHLRN